MSMLTPIYVQQKDDHRLFGKQRVQIFDMCLLCDYILVILPFVVYEIYVCTPCYLPPKLFLKNY